MLHLLVMVMGSIVLGMPQDYRDTHTEQKDPSTPYGFSYAIQDGRSGVNLGHSEERNGRTVHGQYTVLLPDGRTQTVKYQADPLKGFQPTIAYDIQGVSQRLTNGVIKNQDKNSFEDIRRSFPEKQEIIVDQILYPRNDENVGKTQVDYTNERKRNFGTHENNSKIESNTQKEKSNINNYYGSNISFDNLKVNSQSLQNINGNSTIGTLKIKRKIHQYGSSLVDEFDRTFNTNESIKEQELYDGHKKSIKEFHVEDELPKHFNDVSKEEKIYADSQYFEGDFEVISSNVGENLRNSDLAIPNFDTEKSEKINNFNLSNSSGQISKYQSNANVNNNIQNNITSDIATERKHVQQTNTNRKRKNTSYTSNIANERKHVQVTNTNRRRKNTNRRRKNELDAHIAVMIGDGFGSKLSSLSSNIPSQKLNQNNSSLHEVSKTMAENHVNLVNENNGEKMHNIPLSINSGTVQFDNKDTEADISDGEMYLYDEYEDDKILELPHDIAPSHISNENEYLVNTSYEKLNLPKNGEKMHNITLSIISGTMEFDNKDTEAIILDGEMYLDDDYEDDKILELPHDIAPSHISNENAYLINESYENFNLPNNHTTAHTEENQHNIYTRNNSNNILIDEIKSGNSFVDELIENENDAPPVYDNDLIYDDYQYYDDYENYDTFSNQTENLNEEEIKMLTNSGEKIQVPNVQLIKSGNSSVDELIENENDAPPVYDNDLIYHDYQYYDDYENFDTFSNQTENLNEEEIKMPTNSREKIQVPNVQLPIFDFEISDLESFSKNSTKVNHATSLEDGLDIDSLPNENISEKNYNNEGKKIVSSPTPVKDFLIDQTSNEIITNSNNHSQNDTNTLESSPITIKDDIFEQVSDYIYDATTEIIESGDDTTIEQDFNVSEYEYTSEISSIENTKRDNKNYTEVDSSESILSENNYYDSVSSDSTEYITYPTEIFTETVEETEPDFQTHQPNIVVFQNDQPEEVGINTYTSVPSEEDSKLNESISEMPSGKRKFTRLEKENVKRQLPERFRQFSNASDIGVMSGHENHQHRPKKNLVAKQSFNKDLIT